VSAPIAQLIQYFSSQQAKLIADTNGGWFSPNPFETAVWTYNGDYTVNVTGAATGFYSVGNKVRLKQGGAYKYFYIIQVTSTVLYFANNSDYVLTNTAITDYNVSREETPVGFPESFNWVPTFSGFAAIPTLYNAIFTIKGRTCFVNFSSLDGTSNSTDFYITAPVPADSSITGRIWFSSAVGVVDNSVPKTTPGMVYISTGNTQFRIKSDTFFGNWTAANTKYVSFQIWYQI